jgi:DNA-binding YbaB/EbfC family protein
MSKGPGGLAGIFEQAQRLQEQMSRIQEELGSRTVEASAGGGMVTVTMNGRLEVVRVAIEPSVLESGDREMLQDLIVAAVNAAIRKAQALVADEMKKLTGGFKVPGLPF